MPENKPKSKRERITEEIRGKLRRRGRISSEEVVNYMTELDWEDLILAGFTPSDLEEATIEMGYPVRKKKT